MNCPYCGNDKTKVVYTVNGPDRVTRSRMCLKCRERFTTVELSLKGVLRLNDVAKLLESTRDQITAVYNAVGKIVRSWEQ